MTVPHAAVQARIDDHGGDEHAFIGAGAELFSTYRERRDVTEVYGFWGAMEQKTGISRRIVISSRLSAASTRAQAPPQIRKT